jgi:pilus assembly protein Flp/PilA
MERDEKMKNIFKKTKKDESGATAIEYGLIAALIAVVLISSLGLLGNSIKNSFGKISNSVAGAR